MNKRLLYALILIALSVIILIFNTRGRVDINLILGTIEPIRAIAFLIFIGIGVLIGVLLK
ncbi:hypothetical protein ACFLS1_06475 [Verrucomicrobiota bacterium]